MKKIVSYLLMLSVAILYVVSTMGYGIHVCKHDGTQDVIVLFGETPCEFIHSHLDGTGYIYTHAHAAACNCGTDHTDYEHDENCCHTTVYSVTPDQTVADNITSLEPSVQLSFTALVPSGIALEAFFPEEIPSGDVAGKVPPGKDAVYLRYGVLRV